MTATGRSPSTTRYIMMTRRRGRRSVRLSKCCLFANTPTSPACVVNSETPSTPREQAVTYKIRRRISENFTPAKRGSEMYLSLLRFLKFKKFFQWFLSRVSMLFMQSAILCKQIRLSVSLSVYHTLVLYLNKCIYVM